MNQNPLLARAKRLVLKFGTSVLADKHLQFDAAFFDQLALQVAAYAGRNVQTIIVTSGAIAAGRALLGLAAQRPRTLAGKQAAAAVGQIQLMRFYQDAFAKQGLKIAQVLLTHGDFQSRRRFLNARQTLLKLLDLGVVPLINENDTVSVEEILVGDNDNLSALVATLVDANLLVLLSDIDGLYNADPGEDSHAKLIPVVDDVEQALAFAQGTKNPGSTGGMITKLQAARRVGAYGIPTLLMNGRKLALLEGVLQGHISGTLILPKSKLRSRKHWIVHTLKAKGRITVDAGAAKALREQGKSLLPAGVTAVKGQFGLGDPVEVAGPDGTVFARGLVSYGASEIDRLKGHKSADVEGILGYKTHDEIIHRDHLAIL